MLTAERLAFSRIRSNAAFQFRVWRMAVDWTVMLYILIPALIILGYQYVQWWKAAPVWLDPVPYVLFRGYLFIAAVSGTVRYYVEEADQLFLIQRTAWFRRMVGVGAGFSLASHGVWLALAGLFLFPLLRNGYGVGGWEAAALFLFTYLFKVYMMLGKQRLELRVSGWRGFALRVVLTPLMAVVFGLLSDWLAGGAAPALAVMLSLALPLVWLVPARIRAKGTFYRDVQREHREKMKLAGMLMSAAGYPAPRKPKAKRKRTLLWSRSGKLFRLRSQDNVLAESLIKGMLRNPSKLKLVGLAALAYTTAIAVCPLGGIRWIALLAVSVLFAWMSKAFAREAANEAYVQLFPWSKQVRMEAFWKAGAGVTIPACIWFSFVAGLMELGVVQAIVMLPAGAAIGWFISRMFSMSGA